MKLSIFLPSHNKGGYAVEAVRSVFYQSHQDWELWLMENSTDDGRTRHLLKTFTDLDDPRVKYQELTVPLEVRQEFVVCPWLNNQYYPQATGDVILYISDDDLFMPGLFQAVAAHFDGNPGHDALYFNLARTTAQSPGEGTDWNTRWMAIRADVPRSTTQVDCIIDGGQVAYRKHVLDLISQPYFYTGKDTETACHADGLHLDALCKAGVVFHPLDIPGVIHRHTPASTWSKM